jgi:hypothetical protein
MLMNVKPDQELAVPLVHLLQEVAHDRQLLGRNDALLGGLAVIHQLVRASLRIDAIAPLMDDPANVIGHLVSHYRTYEGGKPRGFADFASPDRGEHDDERISEPCP